MSYGLSLITAPSAELLTTAQVDRHLGFDDTYHDQDLPVWIQAARQKAEQYTERAIGSQTWDLILDRFPTGTDPILLPKSPVTSVTSISYIDTDGNSQTWSSSNYTVGTSHEPCRVTRAFNQSWPTIRNVEESVTVRFVCGYTAATLPAPIEQAMLLIVGHLMANRGDEDAGLPEGVCMLLDPYVVGDWFHCYGT